MIADPNADEAERLQKEKKGEVVVSLDSILLSCLFVKTYED